jgi:hypothetical protein
MMKGKRIAQLEREVESLRLSLNLLGHLIDKSDSIENLRERLSEAQIGLMMGADTQKIVDDVLMAGYK